MEQVADFLRRDEADLKDKEQANEARRQQLELLPIPHWWKSRAGAGKRRSGCRPSLS